jgi:CheY-like chemotaxis protein
MLNLTDKPYVLYIDDDVEDVELLKHALADTQFRFEIIHLSNGADALDFLAKSKRYNRLPELIFLDVNLPKMDGRETLVCLKADYDLAKLSIVVLSTSNRDADIKFFGKFHVPYIVKPGDINKFREDLVEVLKGLLAFDVDFSSSRKNIDAA